MNPIGDALAQLKMDEEDTAAKTTAKEKADGDAAAAAHAADVAASDKVAAVSKQNADLDATLKLMEQTYRVK
jgi:hypothetical protein